MIDRKTLFVNRSIKKISRPLRFAAMGSRYLADMVTSKNFPWNSSCGIPEFL